MLARDDAGSPMDRENRSRREIETGALGFEAFWSSDARARARERRYKYGKCIFVKFTRRRRGRTCATLPILAPEAFEIHTWRCHRRR